ncbi:MAG: DUF2326 domain-containing protein [Candidatus Wallbacteria bacterium]|nr:DUF2326 domain-containing protein [Candidatus Wallbacteria bacterium]
MFLKSLIITHGDGKIIRDIEFHSGLNLIVDDTPVVSGKETGNNVGKTTVLKLVDYCLGDDAKGIYSDEEHKKNEYKLVKDFLINSKVLVTLILKEDLSRPESREVRIDRNFMPRRSRVQQVDCVEMKDTGFDEALTSILFPGHYGKKPTFRQMIAHNIRYKSESISNTLKNLNRYTRDDEYETLYLFLLGCDFEHGDSKQELRTKIDMEEKFKKRLEAEQTKSAYESALSILNLEIDELEAKRAAFCLNPDFEKSLVELNQIKYEINRLTSDICRLNIRKNLILEAQKEQQSNVSRIDTQQLRQIYQQATALVSGIQKTFEELNEFHNSMVESKVRFITKELPAIERGLKSVHENLNRLVARETELSRVITQSDAFENFEDLVKALNERYQQKGAYEKTLQQLEQTESTLSGFNEQLAAIDNELFSEEFALKVKEQVNKFNRYFSSVSQELYGEKYALKADPETTKGRRLYKFTAFNLNFSTGKKQGEISCFDIAYTLFADAEDIPCMHFLLNDKKELMHDNQLLKIAGLVERKGIQFVASILKDKLPRELNNEKYFVLRLSQVDKLFRIEKH